MNKKPVEPDEMRMPADRFDEIMRRALGVPPPVQPDQEDDNDDGRRQRKRRPKKQTQ